MSSHARDAVDAVLLLLGGLLALSLLAAATYRPQGPEWPHTVVNGGAWLLLLVCATVLCVSGVRALSARLPRR
jgi:cytochrome c oxidase assembly factor CtaG